MRVSVLIPTCNRPAYVARALRSLLSQTHTDWEALVVDDGDGRGLAAAAAFGDPRIRARRNDGRGQVDARNTALAHATGDAVALLDDDDWWEDAEHLARVVAVLEGGPALVHRHSFMVYEEDGQETARELFALSTTPQSLRENNTVVASSLTYPRAFHTELGPFDPDVGSYYDWDWILRVLDAGYPIRTLPTPGVCYTVHAGGMSAVAATPKRLAYFGRFRQKHGLTITIKNHASLLAETD
jgi:glycosyltransferase involved in cell wall biosynthesis